MTQTEASTIKALTRKTEELHQKVEEKNEEISEVKKLATDIKEALLGDEFNRNGIIQRIESLEKSQEQLKVKQEQMNQVLLKYKWKWAAIVTVGSIVTGITALVYYFSSIIKSFFK